MNLPPGRLIGDHLIHEGLEVGSFLGLSGLTTDQAGGHLQRSKQVDRSLTLICAFHRLDDLAAAGLNVTARTLERLKGRLLINAEHQGILRWVQVKPDDSAHFFDKHRIAGALECLLAILLQAEGTSDSCSGLINFSKSSFEFFYLCAPFKNAFIS